jgi:hypothetical protein
VKRFAFLLAAATAAASASVPACSTSNTATGLTPITAIAVRSDALTAGHGCGTKPDQVFKYVAVVTYDDGTNAGPTQLVWEPVPTEVSGFYDCFADATFVQLDTTKGSAFRVFVYAFNADAWNDPLGQEAVQSVTTGSTAWVPDAGLGFPDAAAADAAADAATDAAADAGADGGPAPQAPTLGLLLSDVASWTTTCTAQQQSDIEVIAVCQPLAPATRTPTQRSQ